MDSRFDVDPWEILSAGKARERGLSWPEEEADRPTRINCQECGKPLTVRELSEIRWATAPCRHYRCP